MLLDRRTWIISVFMCCHVMAIINGELEVLGHCLKAPASPGFLSCFGQEAITRLQMIDDSSNYTIANGLVMIRSDSQASRSLPSFQEQDPMDFRGMLENAGAMISQRSIQWDMSRVYPGLMLKVGPTLGASGVLEFVLDPHHIVDDRSYYSEDTSTARTIVKSFLLPFLLGLKFNLATLLPIVFGLLLLISKKALFLGKLAVFISGLFGFGGLFGVANFGGFGGGYGGGFQHQSGGGYGHGGGYGYGHRYNNGAYQDQDDPDRRHHFPSSIYKKQDKNQGAPEAPVKFGDNFYEYERKQLLKDRTNRLYERDRDLDPRDEEISGNGETTADLDKSASNIHQQKQPQPQLSSGYRNFAWQSTSSAKIA